jgi:hypothetical protein
MADVRAITPMFKPVPGGYVFRTPRRWVFWRNRFYLVNEAQRAELLAIIDARGLHRARGYIFLIALAGLVFSATMIVAYASGHPNPTGRDALVLLGLLPFCIYGALMISIWPIAHRLEPTLAGLTPHPPVSLLDWGRKAPDSATSRMPSADEPSQEQLEEQLLEQIRSQELRTSRSSGS